MRALIQRVSKASVDINQQTVASIKRGVCVFLGIHAQDTEETQQWMIEKILNLRIFEDSTQKMNVSVQDIDAEILVVSQFTLYGDCKKGRRPNFTQAAPPPLAKQLYDQFLMQFRAKYDRVQSGKFGAMMEVSIVNDGPVTLWIESS